MKNVKKLFEPLMTRLLGTGLIVCLSLFAGAAEAFGQEKTEPDFTYGSGGKKVTKSDALGLNVVVTIIDSHGVIRESRITQKDRQTNQVYFDYVVLYDCDGYEQYEKELNYDPVTREQTGFSEKRWKKVRHGGLVGGLYERVQTYGYQWEIDKNGKKITKKYNPKTESYEEIANTMASPNEVGIPERDTSDCSRPNTFSSNEIAGLFTVIREDSTPRFNTYGVNASYTRFVTPSLGLTGDFNANFRTQNGADLSKVSVLGGVTFLPFDNAQTTDKVSFSTHALFGVSHFSSAAGATTFTDNTFTMKLGGALDVNVTDNFFIRPVQIDYAPTFFGDNAQHNVQFGIGGGFRFGRK